MGVYIRHRRGNSACAEILTPPQDGGGGGWRGWGGWGLSKVKFSRSPLITFDDFRDPPPPPTTTTTTTTTTPTTHVFTFQANLSVPLLNPSKVFSDSPLILGSQLRLIPPVCSPKNQVIPPKILRPPPSRR